MAAPQVFPAPAKLNLFLHVLGRRPDGYHLIQTAFTFIDWCDELRFSLRADGEVRRSGELAGVPQEADLTVRAALLLKRVTGCGHGVDILLKKRIPMGSGLGGGSSDAATTLIALNRLWRLDMHREALRELAAQLGADVPIFVFGESAFAEGIGERLIALSVPPAWYLVLTPDVHVSTKEIFSAPNLTRNSNPIKIASFSVGAGRNDLEAVVCERYPEVAQGLHWLKQFADARMTGSGCAVFATFPSREAADAVFASKPASFQGFVARGLRYHPLHSY